MDNIDRANELLRAQESLVLETQGGLSDERRELEITAFTGCLDSLDMLESLQSLVAEEKAAIEEVLAVAIARARSGAPVVSMPGFGMIDLMPGESLPSHFMANDIPSYASQLSENQSDN